MRTPDEIFDDLLVLRCQSGDSDAFATLVEKWHPRMLRLAMRLLHERAEAEDIVQSSWVVAIGKIGSIKDPTALRPWLFRVVANKCADLIRSRQRRRRREGRFVPESITCDSTTSDSLASEKDDRIAALRNAIRSLDREKRVVLRLHYLEGLSVDQIAKSLSLPPGTVKSRLHYARNKLRVVLRGENDE